MSNKRRLPADRAADRSSRPRCKSCGRVAGAGAISIKGGVVCPGCRDAGVTVQRLACGHLAMPGTMVIADSADRSNFQCIRCSPHSSLPEGLRT